MHCSVVVSHSTSVIVATNKNGRGLNPPGEVSGQTSPNGSDLRSLGYPKVVFVVGSHGCAWLGYCSL